MTNCPECVAMNNATDDLLVALEYTRRQSSDGSWVTYNPDEAMHLAQKAAMLSDAAPANHYHDRWYRSEYDDPAMREVEPGAFLLIKEYQSEHADRDAMSNFTPLELWMDHVRWWE